MSEATFDAIEDAIRAHIDDLSDADDPRVLTSWHLIASHAGSDPHSTGYTHVHTHMPAHVVIGLIDRAMTFAREDQS